MNEINEAFIVRPLGDRVIVRRIKEEEKTKGGIYIPEQAKEKPLEGVVLAIGEGRWLEGGTHIPISLKLNDRVLFSRYSGSEIKIREESFLILNVSDIQAVYNWDPTIEEETSSEDNVHGVLQGITPPEDE